MLKGAGPLDQILPEEIRTTGPAGTQAGLRAENVCECVAYGDDFYRCQSTQDAPCEYHHYMRLVMRDLLSSEYPAEYRMQKNICVRELNVKFRPRVQMFSPGGGGPSFEEESAAGGMPWKGPYLSQLRSMLEEHGAIGTDAENITTAFNFIVDVSTLVHAWSFDSILMKAGTTYMFCRIYGVITKLQNWKEFYEMMSDTGLAEAFVSARSAISRTQGDEGKGSVMSLVGKFFKAFYKLFFEILGFSVPFAPTERFQSILSTIASGCEIEGLVGSILDTGKRLLTLIYDAFKAGDYSMLFGRSTDKILIEVEFLLNSDKFIRIIPVNKLELTYDERMARTVEALRLVKTLSPLDVPRMRLVDIRVALEELYQRDLLNTTGGTTLPRPFTVMLVGPPACGKSTMVHLFNSISLAVQGKTAVAANSVFFVNTNDETDFLEGPGFCPSSVNTMVFDEMGSQTARQGVRYPMQWVMKAGQDGGFIIDRAFDKSNNIVLNSVTMLLSNETTLSNLNFWVTNDDAAINRIDNVVSVKFKEGYAPELGSARGDGYDDPENNRTFTVGRFERFAADKWTFVPYTQNGIETHVFQTQSELLRWFEASFKYHYEYHTARMEAQVAFRARTKCCDNRVWATHVGKCGITCDFVPFSIPKKKFEKYVVRLSHGSVVTSDPTAFGSSVWPIPQRPPCIVVNTPQSLTMHWAPFIVLLNCILFAMFFCIAYYPTVMRRVAFSLYKMKDDARRAIAAEISGILDIAINGKRAEVARWIRETKLNYARALLRVTKLLGIFGAACTLAYTMHKLTAKAEPQMDAKWRHGVWPINAESPEGWANPPNPRRLQWGAGAAGIIAGAKTLGGDRNLLAQNCMHRIRGAGAGWGIMIKSNMMLIQRHMLNPNIDGTGHPFSIDERKMVLAPYKIAIHPHKDLALIYLEQEMPGKPLYDYFCKKVVPYNGPGKLIRKDKIYDVNWRPVRMPVNHEFVVNPYDFHYQSEYETINGDCGSLAITESGMILGIHNFEGGIIQNVDLDDIDALIKALDTSIPIGAFKGEIQVSARTQAVLDTCEDVSDIHPFKANENFIPIGKLPGFVMLNTNFTTKHALGHAQFLPDVLNIKGEDFARPQNGRKVNPSVEFRVRPEELALTQIKTNGIYPVALVDRVVYEMIDEACKFEWPMLQPLNPEETMSRLVGKTSAGFGWGGTKNSLVTEEGFMSAEYEEAMIDIMIKLKDGPVATISRWSIKDEPRPISKVESADLRIFEVFGEVNAVGMALVAPLIEFMMLHQDYFCISVGLNVFSEDWSRMYNKLTSMNPNGIIMLDASKYDKSMRAELFTAVATYFHALALCAGYGKNNAMLVYNAVLSVCHRFITVFGELGYTADSNGSGNFVTTWINSVVMIILFRVTFNLTYPDKNFWDWVRLYVYGDDSLASVKPGCENFNQKQIKIVSEALFGIKFSSARKDGNLVEYETIADATFLKRGFNVRDGRVYAPLEKLSIFKMLSWRTPSRNVTITDEQHFIEVGKNAVKEAFLHSRDFYEYVRAGILAVCSKNDLAIELMSWEEIQALYDSGSMTTWDA